MGALTITTIHRRHKFKDREMVKNTFSLFIILVLGACSSMPNDGYKVKYKYNEAVSEAEFNHDLVRCSSHYRDYLASPLLIEPKSKEEYFRYCLSSFGYYENNSSNDKKQFVFNFKDIELNLIKLGK